MDTFSHAAWGATIIRKNPQIWWAALFGALPDLLAALYGLLAYRSNYLKYLNRFAFAEHVNDYYLKVYYFFHSFIPISVFTLILYVVSPSYVAVTIPYYLHILMDIFTHQGAWATRIFYPLSDFHFQGMNWWKNKWITIGNWTAILIINVIIFIF